MAAPKLLCSRETYAAPQHDYCELRPGITLFSRELWFWLSCRQLTYCESIGTGPPLALQLKGAINANSRPRR